jgi:diacylglycerol kinase (ATP)
MMSLTLIVNPSSGRGNGRKVGQRLQGHLKDKGVSFTALETRAPGHATELANSAVTELVVAVGGDGTVNEVANGLIGTNRIMGVVPTGSGNDFIKSAGVPRSMEGAVQVLLTGSRRSIDVGVVRAGNSAERCFVNGVGIGFDAAVAVATRNFRHLRGTLLYVAAVFQTLGKYDSPEMTVAIDGVSRSERTLLLAIGNGKCAGGGFFLTPDAMLDDGLLDVCHVRARPIRRILPMIPRVMLGKHHNVAGVTMCRGKEIDVTSKGPFYVHADGEIVGWNVNQVHVGLSTRRIEILSGGLVHQAGKELRETAIVP